MPPRLEKVWDYQRFRIWVRSSRAAKPLLLKIKAASGSSQQVEGFRGVALNVQVVAELPVGEEIVWGAKENKMLKTHLNRRAVKRMDLPAGHILSCDPPPQFPYSFS